MIAPTELEIQYKFSSLDALSRSIRHTLSNYIASSDGLMQKLASEEPCTPGQMICLAYTRKPLLHKNFEGTNVKATRIVGWATLRLCYGDDRYISFHQPSPPGSYEMMAYVIPQMRYRGIARECILNILYYHKIPRNAHVRVFAPAMLNILKGCDFYKTEYATS